MAYRWQVGSQKMAEASRTDCLLGLLFLASGSIFVSINSLSTRFEMHFLDAEYLFFMYHVSHSFCHAHAHLPAPIP